MSTDAASNADLPPDMTALRALCEQQQALLAQHAATLAQQSATIQRQTQTISQLEQQLARLLKQTYGPRRERLDPDQLLLFDQTELAALAAELAAANQAKLAASPETSVGENQTPSPPANTPRRGHGRQPLPSTLPREQQLHELLAEERRCPCCGEPRCEIGRETSEQLEYVPASYKIIEHIRVKYACRGCQEQVTCAPKPPQPIDKGLPGPGLLAHTVLSKYGDHAPLYRQEDIAARHGILLRRSTLCDWVAAAADLALPLYQRMCELIQQSFVLHTDDTSVRLLDPLFDQARTARFWAYIGDADHPYAVYDFTDSRGHRQHGCWWSAMAPQNSWPGTKVICKPMRMGRMTEFIGSRRGGFAKSPAGRIRAATGTKLAPPIPFART